MMMDAEGDQEQIEIRRPRRLVEAQEEFKKMANEEPDPVKREKLKEFFKLVDQALEAEEIGSIRELAVQTADAARVAVELVKAQEVARKRADKRVVIAWVVTLLAIVILVGTGFRTVQIYKLPDGTLVEWDSFEEQSFLNGWKES